MIRYLVAVLLMAGWLSVTGCGGDDDSGADLFVIRVDGRYGYIDRRGETVIEPQYEDAAPFTEGLAPVKIGTAYGYIDRSGSVIIEPGFDYAVGFRDGLARVRIGRQWGYIDRRGRFVWEPSE